MNTNLTLADQYATLKLSMDADKVILDGLREQIIETGSDYLAGEMNDVSVHLRANKVVDADKLMAVHGVTLAEMEALEAKLKAYKACTKDSDKMTTVITVKPKLALAA